ncbi:L,D-transpeptidase family protein [Flavobacteriales bacterium]|jgi:murein L,D-transpeptidase YafK|nr:L,D-transpeptidase family protein [Flavobacteriales bacterium]
MIKQLFIFIAFATFGLSLKTDNIPKSTLSKNVVKKLTPVLKKEFSKKNLKWGSEVYFRVFKKEKEFEVWVKRGDKFSLYKTYDICYFSGGLGTKTKQGDGKSPEGFYFVRPAQLNPYSSYHLAFNIGYPNSYERQKGYTGSALMVHGECVSIGCYAMGNDNIEEIYTLLQSALENDQPFARIHIFPFRFTTKIMNSASVKALKMYSFWKNLNEGYTFFQNKKIPPNVNAKEGKYVFD